MRVIELQVDNSLLLARITLYSFERLQLVAGKQVWAQIKSVAIVS